jgi:hypothetical protein
MTPKKKSDPSRLLKIQIRKDIRDMYDKISRIDRGELESKFKGSHPNQADFIHRVVNE